MTVPVRHPKNSSDDRPNALRVCGFCETPFRDIHDQALTVNPLWSGTKESVCVASFLRSFDMSSWISQ